MMKGDVMKAILTAILLASAWAGAASAECYGSGGLYNCYDSSSGNSYTVQDFGGQTYMTGRNSRTGSTWSQQTYDNGGGMTSTYGRSSDGGSWRMNTTDYGNGYSSYSGTDSDGNYVSGNCGLLGCY